MKIPKKVIVPAAIGLTAAGVAVSVAMTHPGSGTPNARTAAVIPVTAAPIVKPTYKASPGPKTGAPAVPTAAPVTAPSSTTPSSSASPSPTTVKGSNNTVNINGSDNTINVNGNGNSITASGSNITASIVQAANQQVASTVASSGCPATQLQAITVQSMDTPLGVACTAAEEATSKVAHATILLADSECVYTNGSWAPEYVFKILVKGGAIGSCIAGPAPIPGDPVRPSQ